MTREEARDLLEWYNLWRRDDHVPNKYDMPNPKEIGVAIDVAIDSIDRLINILNKYTELKEKCDELVQK